MSPTLRSLIKGWHIPQALTGLVLLLVVVRFLPDFVQLPEVAAAAPFQAPASVLASLVAALVVLSMLEEPVDQLGATAAVRLRRARAARICGATALAGTALSLGATSSHASWVSVTGLVGEGLLMCRAFGAAVAWILPTAHMLASVTYGVSTLGVVAPWAYLIRTDVAPSGVGASLLIFGLGLTLWSSLQWNASINT